MPSSYSIFTFKSFPEKTTILARDEKARQLTIVERTDLITEILYLTDIADFEKYEVKHYHELSFRGTPYSQGKRIDEVTELHTFDAYVHQDFSIMLMKYGKRICDFAVRRLNQTKPEFGIERQQVDLKSLIPEFHTLRGTYFRDIQIPNVNSGALFGVDVDKSTLYKQLQAVGVISAISMEEDGKKNVNEKELITNA